MKFSIFCIVLLFSGPSLACHEDKCHAPPAPEKPFVVLDETAFLNKPDLSVYGVIKKTRLIYTPSFWKAGEDKQALPPKPRVIEFVSGKYADYKDTLIVDIEHWSLRTSLGPSVSKYVTVLGWMRSAAPAAKLGLYGRPPMPDARRAQLLPSDPAYRAWQSQNDQLMPIALALDVLTPVLYTANDDTGFWLRNATGQVVESKRLGGGKPIYPFLNPAYHTVAAPPHLRRKLIPKAFFLLQLQTLKKLGADGAIIWYPKKTTPWDETAPWWLATKEFLRR